MSRNKEAAALSMSGQLRRRPGGEGEPERWTWRTPLEQSRPFWAGWYTGLSEAFLQVRAAVGRAGRPVWAAACRAERACRGPQLSCPKALVLAGTDRLDRALTIGQMQGRFQVREGKRSGDAAGAEDVHRLPPFRRA
jgi:protein phosphatase methylesterase 1